MVGNGWTKFLYRGGPLDIQGGGEDFYPQINSCKELNLKRKFLQAFGGENNL
jgi:hypothetical protein